MKMPKKFKLKKHTEWYFVDDVVAEWIIFLFKAFSIIAVSGALIYVFSDIEDIRVVIQPFIICSLVLGIMLLLLLRRDVWYELK